MLIKFGTAQHQAQKMNAPKVTFFMLVTNRDVSIADYAVKSYKKVHDEFKDEPGRRRLVR